MSLGALVPAGETGFAELLLGRSFGLLPVVEAEAQGGKRKIEFKNNNNKKKRSGVK